MNNQKANVGRKLSAADMKKLLGGGPGVGGSGTGQRCGAAPPPGQCALTFSVKCCACCAGPTGSWCRYQAQQSTACYLV